MAAQEQQLVVFELESARYGVDIHSVREIIRHRPITMVPDAPPAADGVIDLRGLVVPVVDLRRRLGLSMRAVDDSTRIVVVDILGSVTGFVVDAVAEVRRLSASAIEQAPPLSVTDGSNYIAGIAKLEDRLMMLIDVERALSTDALKRFAEEERRAGAHAAVLAAGPAAGEDLVPGDVPADGEAIDGEAPASPTLDDLDAVAAGVTVDAANAPNATPEAPALSPLPALVEGQTW